MTAHVTPSGTPWTSRSAPLGEHGNARWMVADETVASPRVPTILYVHGREQAEDHFESTALWASFRHRLMDEGWAVVEGLGGATGDPLSTASWGRPAARRAYSAYLAHVAGVLDVGPVVVLGRSMGGIAAANLYVGDELVSRMARGLMLHQAAGSLRALADVPEDGTDGTGAGCFWPQLWDAWGVSGREAFIAASESSDPLLWSPETWRDKAVWVATADGDPTVPGASHGLALRRRWAGQPHLDRLLTSTSRRHTDAGLFGAVDPMMSFLYAATRTVPTPPAGGGYRILSRGRWNGETVQQVVDRRRFEG